jgi:hypothetical protein
MGKFTTAELEQAVRHYTRVAEECSASGDWRPFDYRGGTLDRGQSADQLVGKPLARDLEVLHGALGLRTHSASAGTATSPIESCSVRKRGSVTSQPSGQLGGEPIVSSDALGAVMSA